MPAIGLFYATGKSSSARSVGSKKLEIEKSFLRSPKSHFSISKGGFFTADRLNAGNRSVLCHWEVQRGALDGLKKLKIDKYFLGSPKSF